MINRCKHCRLHDSLVGIYSSSFETNAGLLNITACNAKACHALRIVPTLEQNFTGHLGTDRHIKTKKGGEQAQLSCVVVIGCRRACYHVGPS